LCDKMSIGAPTSDSDLLDLLRVAGPLGVSDMADATEVTATAVRQRLIRLMAKGIIDRDAIRAGRGRPKHLYRLTDKGLRLTGSNFADLALVLWHEINAIEARPKPPGRRSRLPVPSAVKTGYTWLDSATFKGSATDTSPKRKRVNPYKPEAQASESIQARSASE